jgi:hypothetical protein
MPRDMEQDDRPPLRRWAGWLDPSAPIHSRLTYRGLLRSQRRHGASSPYCDHSATTTMETRRAHAAQCDRDHTADLPLLLHQLPGATADDQTSCEPVTAQVCWAGRGQAESARRALRSFREVGMPSRFQRILFLPSGVGRLWIIRRCLSIKVRQVSTSTRSLNVVRLPVR